jgi:hypothetical protein
VDDESSAPELQEVGVIERGDDRVQVPREKLQQLVVVDVAGGDDEQPTREPLKR